MSSLAFTRLRVRRLPGIDREFEMTGISPGINVIHGPNASGKTSTARAIEALLWPRAAARNAWLSGAFRLGERDWTVELDTGHARYQCDGVNVPPPPLPAAELRDRYRLSLHEMLTAEDDGLAEAIARESAGGFDLDSAGALLTPHSVPSRCNKEVKELRNARADLDAARAKQEALLSDERRLAAMDREISEIGPLRKRMALLERADEYAGIRDELERVRAELAVFPPELERVRGDEVERVAALAGRLGEAERAIDEARVARGRAEADLAATGLPEAGLPDHLLPSLRERVQRARNLERDVSEGESKLAEAEARRAREASGLAEHVDEAGIAGLGVAEIRELTSLAEEAEKLRAERVVVEERQRWLGSDGTVADRQRLERGALFLEQWLRTPDVVAGRRQRRLGLIAAGLLLVASIILTAVQFGFGALAVVAAILVYAVASSGRGIDSGEVHRTEFKKLALDEPDEWTPASVGRRLDEIHAELAKARFDDERAQRREENLAHLREIEEHARGLAERRADLVSRIGIEAPDAELVWLVERIGRMQEADAVALGATKALDEKRAQLAASLREIVEILAGFNPDLPIPEPIDVATASGLVTALEKRDASIRDARVRLNAAGVALDTATKQAETLRAEKSEIFTRLGLGEDDEATLDDWCGRHASHTALRNEERSAADRLAALERQLTSMPGFAADLLDAPRPALEEERTTAQGRVDELEPRREEAAGIRALIEEAKRGLAVSDALDGVEAATSSLREMREEDTRIAVALALLDHVRAASRDHNLPRVFHRARSLFTLITRGRYRLDFDNVEAAAFRAFDTRDETGRALDELSSGTRVQLLLAVRLAFIESREMEAKLPLLMDETLANSDDDRAEAVMRAVLELAADGRQVFYFTAQAAEVMKWRAILASSPAVPAVVTDLAAVRRQAERLVLPDPDALGPPEPRVPEPAGLDHAAYGAALEVPRLDPFHGADAVHLWYLIEDLDLLHTLLADGVENWGALRLLSENGGAARLDRDRLARVRAAASALDAALALARIGHGLPVDRAVLTASGAVSDVFLDRAADLCVRVNGDARLLLDEIENGALPRFQRSKIESLREFLEDHHHLDSREPLSPHEVRAGALAAVATDLERALVDAARIDRLLARISNGGLHG